MAYSSPDLGVVDGWNQTQNGGVQVNEMKVILELLNVNQAKIDKQLGNFQLLEGNLRRLRNNNLDIQFAKMYEQLQLLKESMERQLIERQLMSSVDEFEEIGDVPELSQHYHTSISEPQLQLDQLYKRLVNVEKRNEFDEILYATDELLNQLPQRDLHPQHWKNFITCLDICIGSFSN